MTTKETEGRDTHISDVLTLSQAILRTCPGPPPPSPSAWDTPTLNVLDCVLSLNRRYEAFVLPRLHGFRDDHPDVRSLAQLQTLMGSFPSLIEFSVTTLRYADAARAEVLASVVAYLLDIEAEFAGNTEAERLRAWAENARPGDYAFTGIKGFGIAGFQYLRRLLGANTTKPDVHICRFVTDALGRPVSDVEALSLLERAAAHLQYSLQDLDHEIWRRGANAVL
jgi:hypothetical protein